MADGWFYLDKGEAQGPASVDALVARLRQGVITSETMVWRLGADEWKPLAVALPGIAEMPSLPDAAAEPPAGSPLALPTEQPIVRPPPLPIKVPTLSAPTPPEWRTPTSDTAPERRGEWVDRSAHPWRRYFARMFDTIANGCLAIAGLSFALALLSQRASDSFMALLEIKAVSAILITLAAIPLNALLIGLTGGTLGKWLSGVCVLGVDKRPIGFKAALVREFLVWIRGLGLGIPIVILIMCIISFRALNKTGTTSWDSEIGSSLVHRPNGLGQFLGMIVGIVGWVGMIVGLNALAALA